MNARFVICARSILILSAAGLVVAAPAALIAQQASQNGASGMPDVSASSSPGATENPREIAKSAVQRELDALYARQGKQPPRPPKDSVPAKDVKPSSPASENHMVIHPAQPQSVRPQSTPGSNRSAFGKLRNPLGTIFKQNRSGSSGTPPRQISAVQTADARPLNSAVSKQRVVRQTAAEVPAPSDESESSNARRSDIQQQLQKLYQRDGRQMPSMQLSDLPTTPEGATQATQSRDLTRRSGSAVPRRENAAVGFLKRLLPFGGQKRKYQPPAEQHHPPTPPRDPRYSSPTRRSYSPGSPQHQGSPSQTGANSNHANKSPGLLPSFLSKRPAAQHVAAPPVAARPVAARPLQTRQVTRQPTSAPASQRETPTKPEPIASTEAIPKPMAEPDKTAENSFDDLENPFPDVSEAEADRADNPFSNLGSGGVERNEDASPTTAKVEAADQKAAVAAKPEAHAPKAEGPEDAKSETKKAGVTEQPEEEFVIVEIPQRRDAKAANQEAMKQPAAEARTAELPQPHGEKTAKAEVTGGEAPADEETPRDKMRRIAERKGQKGLKGFCPVALRDRRELVDSQPQFVSTFAGNEYHFSSAAAKAKFDRDPSRYAPAASGHDVVRLLNSGDLVQGSLDHAVWFRERLYLFSDRESLQDFVLEPAKHSIVAE